MNITGTITTTVNVEPVVVFNELMKEVLKESKLGRVLVYDEVFEQDGKLMALDDYGKGGVTVEELIVSKEVEELLRALLTVAKVYKLTSLNFT